MAVDHGHVCMVNELQHGLSQPDFRRSPKQPLTTSTRERPSNQVSNNRHRQQRTPVDTDGPSFPGQARRSAGSPHDDLASGRNGPTDLPAVPVAAATVGHVERYGRT
jgi:hypothetical protein